LSKHHMILKDKIINIGTFGLIVTNPLIFFRYRIQHLLDSLHLVHLQNSRSVQKGQATEHLRNGEHHEGTTADNRTRIS
jgi:hypothetical protein